MSSPTPPPTLDQFVRHHRLQAAPWGGWPLFVGMVISLLGYVVSSFIVGFLLQRYGLLNGPGTGAGLAATQLAMGVPVLIVVLAHGNPVRTLGLGRFPWLALVELFFAVGLAFGVSIAWGLLLALFDQRAQPPIVPLFGDSLLGFVVVFVVGAIVAPIVEELVFRGFLFAGLLQTLPAPVAMFVSATLFAALHFQLLAFPVLLLFGLLLALLYYRSGSLWLPILMHFIINGVALCGQYVVEHMPEVASLVSLMTFG